MISSKLKADSLTTKIPVQFRCSFVIELMLKKCSDERQTKEDKSSPFCHSVLGDFFYRVFKNAIICGKVIRFSLSILNGLLPTTVFRLVTVKMRKRRMILLVELIN